MDNSSQGHKSGRKGTVRAMLIIAGHYFVDAAQREGYVEAFRDLVRRARAAPGCLDLAITADALDRRRVNNDERWESEDALAAFRAVADPPKVEVEMLNMQM
jgi:quinol monooxygenase YgiN